MAIQTTTQISIGGTPIQAYKKLSIQQDLSDHHRFELTCRVDVLEKLSEELASETRNFLGETIIVQVDSLGGFSGYKELEFKGVVTEINTSKGYHTKDGDLTIIKGYGASILADDGPHFASHNDVSLAEILEVTFQGYDQSKLETKFSPDFSDSLHYSVRAGESSFEYARRLAAQYGQWFYYNGKALIFGKPEQQDNVILTYGHDLQQFSLNLKPASNKYNFFINDYLSDEQHEAKTADVNGNSNGLTSFTSNKSAHIFAKETNVYMNTFTDPGIKQRLDTQVEKQKKATEIKQVIISGSSDNPGVTLGATISIKGEQTNHGIYRVIKVSHSTTENGKYENQFEAITAEGDIYPNTDIHAYSKSEPQVATVMENSDPDGLSRIRVQFPWQKSMGEMTPWLRVVTPHGGADKGFHFIPEKGEEVLVGFEQGSAERPYVLGGLYNGSASPSGWQSDANNIKAIRTRTGHTIELNDTKGSESIMITDKNQNLVHIDTANNNITISAVENMTLNAKNMQINVEENMDVTVGKNKTENITENHMFTATNEDKQIGEEIKVISSTYKQEAQEITTDASGEIKTNAGGKITIASAETVEYGE